MKAPFMLAAAVLLWGWETESWGVAVPVALAFGAAPLLPLRWNFPKALLYRIADFCAVLVLLLAAYLMVAYGSPRAVILLFQWLPLALLPLALAHAYGSERTLDLGVLAWSLRRSPPRRPLRFDPTFPYFAGWVVAASAANGRHETFYWAVGLLVAWPLAAMRARPLQTRRWLAALACALALGYAFQYGLRELQLRLEEAMPDWIAGSGSRTDPYRSMTDIGQIGELKQSDAIVLRVTAKSGGAPPRLLHRASYNVYAAASWIARDTPFSPVNSGPRQDSWPLANEVPALQRVLVHDFSPQSNPVLSLPSGTFAVEALHARRVTRNALGAVQIERDPGFFSYIAAFAPAGAWESPPQANDLRVSRAEGEYFAQLVTELGLAGLSPATIVERARRHFREHFLYATFQSMPPQGSSPVIDFMRRTRAGHCEYFATATVLLLRSAGVPARYATGFAVLEHSVLEGAWLVRQRHAHAWVRAHVDGAWLDVDTTPPQWFAIEAEMAPAWSAAADLWSWLRFRAARTWAQSDDYLTPAAALILAPFALWLAWRLYRSRRVTGRLQARVPPPGSDRPGADSELYLIEQRLAAAGWGRRSDETVIDWTRRLAAAAPFDLAELSAIVELHCRYRFDPAGISDRERARLKSLCAGWLARGQIAPALRRSSAIASAIRR
jgi:transglutaminase-like putative cysteine protease